MKKLILSLFLLVGIFSISFGQKYAFVDTKYILSEMPDYKAAQKKLDDMSEKWQLEIESKYKEIEVKSKVGEGTTFTVVLPVKEKKNKETGDEVLAA